VIRAYCSCVLCEVRAEAEATVDIEHCKNIEKRDGNTVMDDIIAWLGNDKRVGGVARG
jgi:hypothetical protein